MLAEFKYGLVPKESFSRYVDQSKSHRYFVHKPVFGLYLSCISQIILSPQEGK